MIAPSTFSIVAYDPEVQAWGVAVASKFPAVGAVVPWVRAGAGAVATQAHANTTFGPRGLDLMAEGRSATDALQALIGADEASGLRQIGLVDAQGLPATFTGEDCIHWAGGLTGGHYAVQGNILVGSHVVEAMSAAFEHSEADFPGRLLAALQAGDQAGGDRRGRQSAAIYVARAGAGYAGFNDRWIDYRVDDAEDPVPELVKLLELHRLYFGESPPQERLPIKGEVASTLQRLMTARGLYDGPTDGRYDEQTKKALFLFIGNENFEDRADIEQGFIDRPVLEFLTRKFGDEG